MMGLWSFCLLGRKASEGRDSVTGSANDALWLGCRVVGIAKVFEMLGCDVLYWHPCLGGFVLADAGGVWSLSGISIVSWGGESD